MTNATDGAELLPRRVYLDTQFLFAYLVESDRDHEAAATTVDHLSIVHEAGRITAFVSAVVLNELAWQLAGLLYDTRHGSGSWRHAGKDAAFNSVREEVATTIAALLESPWLRIASADEEACSMYPIFMHRFPLAPADQAHLVIAATSGMDAILTHDKHFHQLQDSPVPIMSYRRKP